MKNDKITSIALSKNEQNLIDSYRKKYGLSRSACIRLILNDFFIKNQGVTQ